MNEERTQRLTDLVTNVRRDRSSPNQTPKNAATLIILDRSGDAPKVLMGQRHAGHKFMPGKVVFPGGRIEPDDRRMPASGEFGTRAVAALSGRLRRPSAGLGRALALTAIRETYEETGLMLGRTVDAMPPGPAAGAWRAFFDARILPDLAGLHYVGRAITPPGRPRRFDTRFFAADRNLVAAEMPGFIGPDKELVDLVWVGLDKARDLDLPPITVVMLEELEHRIEGGLSADLPVPFYFERRKRFVRELL